MILVNGNETALEIMANEGCYSHRLVTYNPVIPESLPYSKT